MPSAFDLYMAPGAAFLQGRGHDLAALRESSDFWNPSHTVDGFPISYGGPQYRPVPGALGLVPGQFAQYAQTYPERWNRLWNLGAAVLKQIPTVYGNRDNPAMISMFPTAFLTNGYTGLSDLWAGGSQFPGPNGEMKPWDYSAPVPGILSRILGVDISSEASNRINAANGLLGRGGLGGFPDGFKRQITQEGRANRYLNNIILGIEQQPQQQFDQQPQQQGIDWNRVGQAIAPILGSMRPQRSPSSWYGNTANAGASRAPSNYGSPY